MRGIFFFWLVLLGSLAFMPQLAFASPMVARIEQTQATLTLLPDPPTVGTVHAVLQLQGVRARDTVNVHFSTSMPTMSMNGASGIARSLGDGRYGFDLPLQAAVPWSLTVQLSGAVAGQATYQFAVASGRTSASSAVGSMPGMSGPGDPTAWRTATFVLIGVILVGALVLRRDRRTVTIALVVGVALVVVVVAIAQSRYGSPAIDMTSMQSAAGSAPVPVTLATVGRDDSARTSISAPANIAPYLTQSIVARAPGLLTDLSAYTGDRLRAGQVVAHLSEPELQSDAQAAAADAEAARIEALQHAPNGVIVATNDAAAAQADVAAKARQDNYWSNELGRERELLAQGAVSQREYEDEAAQAQAARSAYRASQDALNSARTRIGDAHATVERAQAQAQSASATAQSRGTMASYTTIVVPNDSVVMKRLVDPGVYVQVGTPVLQVAVVDRLRVQAQVAQRDLSSVHIGTPIVVTLDSGASLHGAVSSISPVVDPQTHTATVEAIVSNAGDRYQPGGFAHIILRAGRRLRSNAFSVPSTAVVGGANTAIWIDVAGTAHRVPVTVLSDDGVTAEVTGAISSGTRAVVVGASALEEGQAIVEAGEAPVP